MFDRTAFILVAPQMGENIGAAARAMMNFGITDLRLVRPRDGWPNDRAIDMGAGAFDHIHVQVFDTLSDAAADLHKLYATTARARDMVKPVFTPDAVVRDAKAVQGGHAAQVGFVFGPERTGLENDDLSRCHAIINVPTNPDFSSLNLGQCVLLIAYALSSVRSYGDSAVDDKIVPMGDSAPVTQDKLDEFLSRLERELDDTRFFKTGSVKAAMVRNIRNMFVRNDLSDQEVKTLHGIVSALRGSKIE
ncbi:MAG: RNA methyltransferase [Alphaproteobacteria bacterium]|nr:RNA methyltransferase [Alphaproteobacteria bacterium]